MRNADKTTKANRDRIMNAHSEKATVAAGNAAETGFADVADTGGRLKRLSELGRELGSERVADEAMALAGRLAEGRFYVACIGQFKRGKSTLLNALVGDRALPTGVVPVTAVPTVLRYGRTRSARVRLQGGAWMDIAPEDLAQYVSEEHNPENAKGIAGVEVFVPCPLLEDGMCLVDTPGLGSVFLGNTATTQGFVPHIDAAVIVLGADPPIAGEELTLVEKVGKQVRQLLVVLNKADRTSDTERRIAARFTRQLLEKRLGRPIGPIYEISAFERLQEQKRGWDWDALAAALQKLVEESGRALVRTAGERGLRRFGDELLAITAEEREALLRPIEESERRIATMRKTIGEAERSLRDMGHLFIAEQHRLSDLLLERRKEFLGETLRLARAEFTEQLLRIPRKYGPKFRREAMRSAQEVAVRSVLPWLAEEQRRAEEEYLKVASRFVGIGNDFLKSLSESGVPELARMPKALDAEKGFRVASRFRFEDLIHVARPASPLRYLGDVCLGLVRAFSVIEKEAHAFLEYLLEMNSARVQSDVVDRVQESRGQLEVEIRKLLHEVARIATSALEHAREDIRQGASAVETKLTRIAAAEQEIHTLFGS
jgi:Dynamin family